MRMKTGIILFLLVASTVLAADPEQYHSIACDDLPSMKQRVECRINFDKDYQEIPELCRTIGGGTAGEYCVDLHQRLASCLVRSSTATQLRCARDYLAMQFSDTEEAFTVCHAADNSVFCREQVRHSTLALITFKFDILIFRVEQLYRAGKVSESLAVTTIIHLE